MPKIQKLPESLVRLIAAGEVIERPASVVKELVENSLDAGATQISVDVWGAGQTRIRISDNGEGMSREDAELALDRHATSKLRFFEDLQKLRTFGFRGEALPSIAAVSRFELTTRTTADVQGCQLKFEGGRLVASRAIGTPPGTTVDVQDLFFNTPARSKFLKRDSTERSHILRALQEQAMAHPLVGFHVNLEGKEVLELPAVSLLNLRLTDLWGPAIQQHMVPLEFTEGPLGVSGFINTVPAHHPTKAYQYLFVNHRPLQQRLLTHAVYEAYHEWLPVGRHPIFALFIEMDPAAMDVNVHPAKREVRFSNERSVYDVLFNKIRRLLQASRGVPVVEVSARAYSEDVRDHQGRAFLSEPSLSASTPVHHATNDLDLPPVVADAPTASILSSRPRILGQFHHLYVLAEQGDELLIIDQHAAAERVLYEKLLSGAKMSNIARQPLLTPALWELTADQAEIVQEARPALEDLGFGLEPFGANAFALKEWPACFPQLREAKRFLNLFLQSLQTDSRRHEENASHEAVASAACRAAIKANDALATQEMQHLLEELANCQRPMTCPHGRPTYIRLPLSELHRRFRRT